VQPARQGKVVLASEDLPTRRSPLGKRRLRVSSGWIRGAVGAGTWFVTCRGTGCRGLITDLYGSGEAFSRRHDLYIACVGI